ncbi:MAG: hypothetical protein ABIG11_06060, partial [bacterium]
MIDTLTETLILAWETVANPRQAFRRLRENRRLVPPAAIYVFFTAAHSVFYCLKPRDFPAEAGLFLSAPPGLPGWLWTEFFWGSLFLTGWLYFLCAFLGLVSCGRMSLKLPASLAAAVLPSALHIFLARNGHPVIMIAWVFVTALIFLPFFFRFKAFLKDMTALLLCLNAVEMVLLPLLSAAVLTGSEKAYMAFQTGGALWML